MKDPARSDLETRQLGRLTELLQELVPGNRFWSARLRAVGLDREPPASLTEFAARLPLLAKAELIRDQEDNGPYGSNLTFDLEQYTRFHQTSSTTGRPLRWLDREKDWDFVVGNWRAVLEAAGVTASDRAYFAFSFGPFLGFWAGFDAATRLGCLTFAGGALGSEGRLQAILEHEITVLCCTPTYALYLAEVAARLGRKLTSSQVRCLLVAGEPGGSLPALREQLEGSWPGARVFDHYGMTEVGPVAYQTAAHPQVIRILERSYVAELVDPATGAALPTEPGVTGELVLTSLGRVGCPLLRYRTGDLVQIAETPAGTGSDLALEGGILGRVDDMVVVRGVNVYPSAVDQVVRSVPDVAEYRVAVLEQQALTELRVEIEPGPAARPAEELCRNVAKGLREALHLRVPVVAVASGSLPRFELKARRWVRASGTDESC